MGGPIGNGNWLGPLYGYLSSGIPVIILCAIGDAQHAVLAVGIETAATEEQSPPSGSLGTVSFARTIQRILVHDDRWGPFTELTPEHNSLMATLRPIGGSPQAIQIRALVVPLPKGMVLLSEHAHAIGISFLTEAIPNYLGPFRTFAQQSVDFKRETLDWHSLYPASAAALRALPMSK